MDEANYLERTKNGTVFVGSDINIFKCLTLASGLKLYAITRIQPSRHWTPSAMLKAATSYTGKTYKRGEYERAASDLTTYANYLKGKPRTDS